MPPEFMPQHRQAETAALPGGLLQAVLVMVCVLL